ncbi:hypothetical protein A3770_01p07050 [Chloropicon primus]|uniref:Uncharacterized protein n=1 Tax=Chloropicon primus TaxID=1764295 RepID=A0A5B8MCH5_9CHLO|nr:hypothetical protein A3770_01p07050 [Chloropicon primus]|eukprot:QDZ18187.1 hypothetical protein A3770_01p07050 [Chloropicon primus]
MVRLWPSAKFFQLGAGIATCYFLVDATEELSLFLTCRDTVTRAANANAALKEEIGDVITPGQYWDSSLRTTHHGNVVHSTIPVRGGKGSSDVVLKLVKSSSTSSAQQGGKWLSGIFGDRDYYCPGENLIYNHLGRGEWKVLVHYAVIGGAGSLPKHFNLEERDGKQGD